MTAYKPQDLLTKLKSGAKLENIILVYGENTYYRKKLSACIVGYVFQDVPEEDREISVFEKETNLGELEGAINSYPFFCGRSLIVISDDKLLGKAESETVKKQQERLGKLLEDVPEYCTVFINVTKLDGRTKFTKELLKASATANCEPVRVYNLEDWLEKKAKELGGMLSRDAVECIMEYLEHLDEAPLELLEQELEKLSIYVGTGKRWNRKDVEAVFASLPEAGSFALSNAMADKKLTAVLEVLASEKKKGTAVIKLCGGLMYQLRKFLQIKELQRQAYNSKQIGEALNIKFMNILNRNLSQCGRFSEQDLREALLALSQLNIDLRKGGRDYARLEEILVELLSR